MLLAEVVSQFLRRHLDNVVITHRTEALTPATQTEAANSLLSCVTSNISDYRSARLKGWDSARQVVGCLD